MIMSSAANVHHLRIADGRASVRHVFVRDLELKCSIGVYEHEHLAPQKIRINLDLAVLEGVAPINDDINNVVCYERITNQVRAIVADGHTKLVETLAERIADSCLANPLVRAARVRIEKLEVFADAASVGVEIERFNTKG